ncbi:MAG: transcriptional repressor [Candidatus Competibacteraceae bacterium]|nr:transcriptional repressor [Candidatus Competibacteraceae bacterium]MBK7983614.1 transcriptional repressor [Candidatus Competibacteraceae bacterium]MBK8897846.1 transcriptional repressor [Candidatus Competibacteraceae bacterium]MBK8961649.1 transcriptional repressor [Candidatus Competibacteraceae bacterium]MBK9950871.1 transcriptional repressor [Candidatus Competibacteraceae bacterium]
MISLKDVNGSHAIDPQHALEHAASLCQQRGTRLTELRRRVLEIIWSNPTPVGAYAILDVLRGDGRQGAPPTVYRALDFLLEQGLIHRLASLNVFTGCHRPDHLHGGQFLICQECGRADELSNPAVEALLRAEASARHFEVLAQTVEVLGHCPRCQQGAAPRAR